MKYVDIFFAFLINLLVCAYVADVDHDKHLAQEKAKTRLKLISEECIAGYVILRGESTSYKSNQCDVAEC